MNTSKNLCLQRCLRERIIGIKALIFYIGESIDNFGHAQAVSFRKALLPRPPEIFAATNAARINADRQKLEKLSYPRSPK
jgi:hypothetical protein